MTSQWWNNGEISRKWIEIKNLTCYVIYEFICQWRQVIRHLSILLSSCMKCLEDTYRSVLMTLRYVSVNGVIEVNGVSYHMNSA